MIISNQDYCIDSERYFKIKQSPSITHYIYLFRNEKAKHICPTNLNLYQHLQNFQYDLLSNKIYWHENCFYPTVSIKKIEANENNQIGIIKLSFLNFSFQLNFLNRHRDFCESQQNQKKDYFVDVDQSSAKNVQNSTFSKIKINRIFFQKSFREIDDKSYSGLFRAMQTICISKLLSILKLGPKFQPSAGFDFLFYQRALIFFQEDCHNIVGYQSSLNKQIMIQDLEFIQMLGINQNRFDRSLIGFSHAHKKYVFCQIKNKFHIKQSQEKKCRKILICKKLKDCYQLITNEIIFDRSAEQQKFYRKYLEKYQKEVQCKSRPQNMQKRLSMPSIPLIFNLFKAKYLLFKEEKQAAKNLYKTIHRKLTQNMFITKNIQKMSPKKENWTNTIQSQLSKTQEGVKEQFYINRINLVASLIDKKIVGVSLRNDLKNQILQRLLNFQHSQRSSQQFTIFYQHLIFFYHQNIDEYQLEHLMVNCMSKINPKIHISTHWQSKESIVLEFCAKALEIYHLIDKNDSIISTIIVSQDDKQLYLYYLLITCKFVCQFNISMEIFQMLRRKIESSTQIRKYISLQIIYNNIVMITKQNWSFLDDQLDLVANSIKDTSIQSLCMIRILRSLKNSSFYQVKLIQQAILDQNQLLKQFQQLIKKQKGKDDQLLVKYTGFLYLKRFMSILYNTKKDENYTINLQIAKQMKQLMVNDDQENASFQYKTIENSKKNDKNQLNNINFLCQFVDKEEQFQNRIDLNKFINKRLFKFNIFRIKPYKNLYYYTTIFQYISQKNITQKQNLIQKSQQAAKTNNQKLINLQCLTYILAYKHNNKQNQMLYETNDCFSKLKKVLFQQLNNSKEQISFLIHQRILEYLNPTKYQSFLLEYAELFFKNIKCDSKNFHLMVTAYLLKQDKILEKIKLTNYSTDLATWQEAITVFQKGFRQQQQLQNVENFVDFIIKKQDVIFNLKSLKGHNYFKKILEKQDFYQYIYTDFIKIAQYLNRNDIMLCQNRFMNWVLVIIQTLAYGKHFEDFFKVFISTKVTKPNIFIALIGSILLSFLEKRNNFLQDCQSQRKKQASQIIIEEYYKINISLQNRLNQSHIVTLINLILQNLKYTTHPFRKHQVKFLFKTYKIYYYMSEYFYSKRFYYLLKHLHCSQIVTSKQFKELKQQVQSKVKNKKNNRLGKAVLKKISKMKKNCIPEII